MESLSIHKKINEKLDYFLEANKIPHIIFYGPSGSGKRTILYNFIKKIYKDDKHKINSYVMYVNCSHSKGIRFIRDELKFFAKTNIHNKNNFLFKSIVLFNADQLTTDAQSALRRCIEQFSHTTRFFVIVENENRLLKPILSRFCNIFIPYPHIDNKLTSLHEYNKQHISNHPLLIKRTSWLKKNIVKKKYYATLNDCNNFVKVLYEKGYCSIELLDIIESEKCIETKNKYFYLIYFDKIRSEFRDEKLLMFLILNLFFMRKNLNLENILEM